MKKSILFLLIIVSIFTTSYACQKDTLKTHVSQCRTDVFMGESQNYTATIFCEKRETPFVNDAYVGELKNYLIVRIHNLNAQGVSIVIKYQNYTFESETSYDPIITSLVATIPVKKLPTSTMTLSIVSENSTETLTLSSMLKATTITPNQALSSISKEKPSFIKNLYQDGKIKAEVYIRLLVEEDLNFYYVGFATGNGQIDAFLLDGESGKIIAGKEK